MRIKSIFIFLTVGLFLSHLLWAQDTSSYSQICEEILKCNDAAQKLRLSTKLNQSLILELSNSEELISLDSTGLLIEHISTDGVFQMLTWAIEFNEHWEYFGLLKSYDHIKKEYKVYDLYPSKFMESITQNSKYDNENWPAGIYVKLIENEYNKRKYYTFLGWLAPDGQTAYKFIEVMTLSKSGKPYFGKTNYFKDDKNYNERKLFSYNRQSKFLLDYGTYQYSIRQWNKKKKRYDSDQRTEKLIVFDHLISQYPNMEHLSEFLVPVGNLIDAFLFEKGKWIYISDIDARNIKRKEIKKAPPALNLFKEKNSSEFN
jgi:hypothetical protein